MRGGGGEYEQVPTVLDTSKYFTAKLGLGNMSKWGGKGGREGGMSSARVHVRVSIRVGGYGWVWMCVWVS